MQMSALGDVPCSAAEQADIPFMRSPDPGQC